MKKHEQQRDRWIHETFSRYTDTSVEECGDSFDGAELVDFMRDAYEEGRKSVARELDPGTHPMLDPATARTLRELVKRIEAGESVFL